MYLPTTISDINVRKAFDHWGVVHDVFQGTYKRDFHEIKNGKRHVRVTPHNGDKSCFPHTIQFLEKNKIFRVVWAEKIIDCNKCFTEHMLKDDCSAPDGHDALTVKRSENDEQVDDVAEIPKPFSFLPSAPSGPPQSYSSEVNQNLV